MPARTGMTFRKAPVQAILVKRIGNFRVADQPIPTLAPSEVLVRVSVTGLCRTDLKIVRNGHRDLVLPRVPGEEVVGVVEAIGPAVTRVRAGQRVYLYPGTSCGACPACLRNAGNLCRSMQIMGFHRDGGFAEYVATPEASVIALPDNLTDDAAIFAEPLSCCLNALERAALRPGDTVGVWGAGPAGMLLRRAAENQGAQVWTVEPDDARRSRVNGHLTPPAEGCDIAVVAVGNLDAYRQALGALRPRGCLVLFSGLAPEHACQPIDLNHLHYLEQRLVGAYGCTYSHSVTAVELLASGKLRVDDLVSHRLPLGDLDTGLDIVAQRAGLKVLLYP